MHHHHIDRFAYQDSLIHRLDARAKTLAVLAYSVVLISLPRYTIPSPWYLVFPGTLLLLGGIPLRFVVKHTLIVSPFISNPVVSDFLEHSEETHLVSRQIPRSSTGATPSRCSKRFYRRSH